MISIMTEQEIISDLRGETTGVQGKDWPEEVVVLLNSKRITTVTLHRITVTFSLLVDTSITDTRLMIDGKLNKMGHDPRNVQVVIQGQDDNSPLFLVSDMGIIKSIERALSVLNEAVGESHDTIKGGHMTLSRIYAVHCTKRTQ